MSNEYDVIVAGGGPAGTAAAITAARRGARVLLLERGRYPRQKVCGEFVSPESLGLLRDLLRDVPEALAALESAPRIRRARVWLGSRHFDAAVKPAGASVARYDLDAWLWQAAGAAGVERVQGEAHEIAELPNCRPAESKVKSGKAKKGFRLGVAADGEQAVEYVATAVINAAGRSSRLSRKEGAGVKWLGLKAHFRAAGADLDSETTELFTFEDGYCGVQPVLCGGEKYVNVCALVRAGSARSIEGVLAMHPELRQQSLCWDKACDAVATGAVAFHQPRSAADRTFLAGDAAGFIDPFVGDGIAIALRSGTLAGECAAKAKRIGLDAALKAYDEGYHMAFDSAFRNARRLRKLLGMPRAVTRTAMALLKLPGAAEWVVRGTRSA